MNFNDVFDEDEAPLSKEEELIIEKRLADYHKNPEEGVSWEELVKRLRARFDS